jgi:hypothetical protein
MRHYEEETRIFMIEFEVIKRELVAKTQNASKNNNRKSTITPVPQKSEIRDLAWGLMHKICDIDYRERQLKQWKWKQQEEEEG